MKRKLDFIISQDKNKRIIFRFYPRQSYCHSFNDEPPKSWKEVYKVYYSYSVLRQYKLDKDDKWETEIMFQEDCDECSIIDEVGERCLLLSQGYETFEGRDGERYPILDDMILPSGMGANWTIHKTNNYYKFTLFDYFDKGYRFCLQKEKVGEFGQYLLDCCEYMLKHGESI